MGLFKSKEQRNKEKLKKEIKGKISAIGQGGGHSKQAHKKRLQRELKAVDAPKKERKKSYGRSATAYGTRDKVAAKIEADNKSKSKSKSKATMTGKERAQAMAKARIAAKKAGTYKAPKTAQQLAKERLAKKKKK